MWGATVLEGSAEVGGEEAEDRGGEAEAAKLDVRGVHVLAADQLDFEDDSPAAVGAGWVLLVEAEQGVAGEEAAGDQGGGGVPVQAGNKPDVMEGVGIVFVEASTS